jgi:hypothetical protein
MNFVRLKHEIEEVKEKTKSFVEFCSQIGGEISKKVKETTGAFFCNVDADNLKGTVPDVFATMISTKWAEPNDLVLRIVHSYHEGGKESYEALSLHKSYSGIPHNDAFYVSDSYGDVERINSETAEGIVEHKRGSWRNLYLTGRGDMEQLGEDKAIRRVTVYASGKRRDFPTTWEDWNFLLERLYGEFKWPLMEKLDEKIEEAKKYGKPLKIRYI